jgi:hypothetical protein
MNRVNHSGFAICQFCICRIWYSISQTASDGNPHRGKPMIARSALSPLSPAPSARRYAASELDRSARSSKPPTVPLKARPKIENIFADNV